MSIKSFLEDVAGYRDYGADFRLVAGVGGRFIVCVVNKEPYVSLEPVELVCMGWDDAHALESNHGRTHRNSTDQQEILELSDEKFTKVLRASRGYENCNKKLRADLLAACGLEKSK